MVPPYQVMRAWKVMGEGLVVSDPVVPVQAVRVLKQDHAPAVRNSRRLEGGLGGA